MNEHYFAQINDSTFSKTEFFDMMTELVKEAIAVAPTAGDHTDTGLVCNFAMKRNWI